MQTPAFVAAALLVVLALGLLAPAVATSVACADGGADCCGLDCAMCLCCAHCAQTVLSDPARRAGNELDGRLGPETSATPRETLPRDILHVPRSAPVR